MATPQKIPNNVQHEDGFLLERGSRGKTFSFFVKREGFPPCVFPYASPANFWRTASIWGWGADSVGYQPLAAMVL